MEEKPVRSGDWGVIQRNVLISFGTLISIIFPAFRVYRLDKIDVQVGRDLKFGVCNGEN